MDVVKLPKLPWETPVQNALREMERCSCSAVVVGSAMKAALFTAKNLVSGLQTLGETTMDQVPGAISLPMINGVSPDRRSWTTDTTQQLRRLFTAPDISYGLTWQNSADPYAFVVAENDVLGGHLSRATTIYSCSGNPSHFFLLDQLPTARICPYDKQPITG